MDSNKVSNMENTVSTAKLCHPEDREDASLRCGWLGYRPDWLQRIRTPTALVACICLATIVMGIVPLGFVSVCVTTIEKKFHYKSRDSGIIVGSFNVAFLFLCVPVAHLASRPHASKPRWLGWGMIIMGLGSFVYSLPHFLSPSYSDFGVTGLNTSSSLCTEDRESDIEIETGKTDSWHRNFLYVFVLGQFLHGVGSTPLFVLGLVFIDESVSRAKSSFYVGVHGASAVGGVALGFIFGSAILNMYIDWPYTDPALLGLSPGSDLWLGCWWLCFIISGFTAIFVGLALLAFPRKMPFDGDNDTKSSSDILDASPDERKMSSQLLKVFRNVPFMSLAFAEGFVSLLGAGMSAFMPKLVENQFSLPASYTALIVGAAGVPSGVFGSLFSGWIMRKFKVGCSGALKLCFCINFVLIFSSLGFMIYCENPGFAGVQLAYENTANPIELPNLESQCNIGCGCDSVSYNPVCGANGVIYYSPCHAGCTESLVVSDKKISTKCNCIDVFNPDQPGINTTYIAGVPPETPFSNQDTGDFVVQDKCTTDCNKIPLFISVFVVIVFITFSASVPSLTAGLRSVDECERPVAFAVRSEICRVLGNVPGPILFGVFIDKTCLLWEQEYGAEGSCAVYQHRHLSTTVVYIFIVIRSISVILYGISWWSYNRNVTKAEGNPKEDLSNQIEMQLKHINYSSCQATQQLATSSST